MAERAGGATDVDGRKRAHASGVRPWGGQTRVPLTRSAPGLMIPRVPASPPAAVANTDASPPQRQVRDRKKRVEGGSEQRLALLAPAPAAAAPALARKAYGPRACASTVNACSLFLVDLLELGAYVLCI